METEALIAALGTVLPNCSREDAHYVELAQERLREIVPLKKRVGQLREALAEIHTHAHCISKAGPLHTKTLADAWSKFDQIGVMATYALAASTHSNLKLD